MPNLVMATIMAVSGQSVDSALCTRWTYCPRLEGGGGEATEAATILISHSQEDSDHFEDVLPAVPVQVTKMQMDVSF